MKREKDHVNANYTMRYEQQTGSSDFVAFDMELNAENPDNKILDNKNLRQ